MYRFIRWKREQGRRRPSIHQKKNREDREGLGADPVNLCEAFYGE